MAHGCVKAPFVMGPFVFMGLKMWKHRLTNKDFSLRTAICSSCGPVKIGKHGKHWRCSQNHAAYTRDFKAKAKLSRDPVRERSTACEICGHEKPLCWDHDHQTGLHRGWLCTNCNIGLGSFFDDVQTLEKAIIYLKDSRKLQNVA